MKSSAKLSPRRARCGRDVTELCWGLSQLVRPFEHGSRWKGLRLVIVANYVNAAGREGRNGNGAKMVSRAVGVVAEQADPKARPRLIRLPFCPVCGRELHEQSPRRAFRSAP
jgi:hypothetical protein